MKPYILIILFLALYCLSAATARAQDNKLLSKGNELYKQQKYQEAANAYNSVLKNTPNSIPALFNLSNSLYQQNKPESARKMLEQTLKNSRDKQVNANAQYNIGNTYMTEKKWDDAIEAYKKSLRDNPNDPNAKYNLSYAKAMKQKEEQNNKNKKDNKDNKDNKNNKDEKDKQDKKDDKQDQNQDKNDKEQQDQKPEPQPSKLSEEQANQILNALQQDEKKLQDKKQKGKGVPVNLEKDW